MTSISQPLPTNPLSTDKKNNSIDEDILISEKRLLPETMEILEDMIDKQCDSGKLNFKLNLTLLQSYQIYPETFHVGNVAKILALALMSYPSQYFESCLYLMPAEYYTTTTNNMAMSTTMSMTMSTTMSTPSIGGGVSKMLDCIQSLKPSTIGKDKGIILPIPELQAMFFLEELLTSCRYSLFWHAINTSPIFAFLKTIKEFTPRLQANILQVIQRTFSRIQIQDLAKQLNIPTGKNNVAANVTTIPKKETETSSSLVVMALKDILDDKIWEIQGNIAINRQMLDTQSSSSSSSTSSTLRNREETSSNKGINQSLARILSL